MKVGDRGCCAGCRAYSGGEIKHHKDCVFYPDSLSEKYDKIESQNKELREQLQKFTHSRPVLWNDKPFNSQKELVAHLNVSYSAASRSIAQGTRLKGYYVKYKEDE